MTIQNAEVSWVVLVCSIFTSVGITIVDKPRPTNGKIRLDKPKVVDCVERADLAMVAKPSESIPQPIRRIQQSVSQRLSLDSGLIQKIPAERPNTKPSMSPSGPSKM